MIKRYTPILFLALLLSACQQANSPTSVVESYLKGDFDAYCVKADAESLPLPATWKIGQQQEQTDKQFPEFHYTLVTAEVDGKRQAFQVWKTEEVFRHEEKVFQRLSEKGIQIKNALAQRDDWSPKDLCVVLQNDS